MISLYGTLIAFAILVAILVAEKLIVADNKDANKVWDLAFYGILFGVIGARLYHVIDYWSYYKHNLGLVFAVWNGGLGIFGAVFGGVCAVVWVLKKQKESVGYWLDIIGVVLPLAQAIGRWGNYFNQEVFGPPTTLPWGIYIEPAKRPEVFANFERFHPLFLYESLLNLGLFVVLLFLKKKTQIKTGTLFLGYLTGYSLIRLFLEFFRLNSWNFYGLNVAQVICIIVMTTSFGVLYKLYKRGSVDL